MLLDKVFDPFIREKPICVMARATLQRILDPQHLDQLFARTAQRQYTHQLLFSSLVDLMTRVILGQEPSVPASHWSVFEICSAAQMARVLREIASHVSLHRYRKTPRGPKKPPPPRRRYKNGEHVATSQLIAERKRR